MTKRHCAKVCYATKKSAKAARRRLGDGGLRAYKCVQHGGAWHLGHQPEVVKRGIFSRSEIYGEDR